MQFKILENKIMKLATKKKGSQFLQSILRDGSDVLINKIFDSIDGHF